MVTLNEIKLNEINNITLASSKIGDDINDRFDSINKNFKTIIRSKYLQGKTGNGVQVVPYEFTSNPKVNGGIEVYIKEVDGTQTLLTPQDLFKKIKKCIDDNFDDERLTPGQISLLCEVVEEKNVLKSILPYIFIDKKFLESDIYNKDKLSGDWDHSCIIYYDYSDDEEKNFQKSDIFPQIYYNEGKKSFCWKLNGENTELVAQGPQGPQGPQGNNGTVMYFTKYQHDGGNKYQITKIYDISQSKWVSVDELVLTGDTNTLMETYNGCLTISVPDYIEGTDMKIDRIVVSEDGGMTLTTTPSGVSLTLMEMLKNNNTHCEIVIPCIGSANIQEGFHMFKDMNRFDGSSYGLQLGAYKTSPINNEFNMENIDISDKYTFCNKYGTVLYDGNVSFSGNVEFQKINNSQNTVTFNTPTTLQNNVTFMGSSVTFSNPSGPVAVTIGAKAELKSANEGKIVADELSSLPTFKAIDNQIYLTGWDVKSPSFTIPFATNAEKLGNIASNCYMSFNPTFFTKWPSDNEYLITNGSIVWVSEPLPDVLGGINFKIDKDKAKWLYEDPNSKIMQFSIIFKIPDNLIESSVEMSKIDEFDDLIKKRYGGNNLLAYRTLGSSIPIGLQNIMCEKIYTFYNYRNGNTELMLVNTGYFTQI